MKKRIKLFPILVALVTSTSDGSFSLRRSKPFSSRAAYYEQDESLNNSKSFFVNSVPYSCDFIPSDLFVSNTTSTTKSTTTTSTTTTSTTTTSTTTTSTTTTSTTTTSTTTTSTTESIYKDLIFLEDLNNNYDSEGIHDIICKYSGYCNLPYDNCVSILNENTDRIISYSSFEEGVMRTLFECASENGLLSGYCTNGNKVTKEMNKNEKESIMLEMCDVMNLSSDDKKMILSIFRWETGHGTSDLCVNSNNYGGIRVSNGEFGIYQTPEYGMYRAITCMYGHICRARTNGCDDIYSILSYISHAYCPGNADEWTNRIYGMVSGVSNDYNFDEKILKKNMI